MATFFDFGNVSNDLNFQKRVLYALGSAAINVKSEGSSVTNHAIRTVFCDVVLGGQLPIGGAHLVSIASAVLTDATVSGQVNPATTANGGYAVTDAALQNAVNAMWNAFSGVP